MKMIGQGIDRVSLVAKDNLEGLVISIICKKVFKERAEIQLIPNLNKIKELINLDTLEPVKSLLVVGKGLEKETKSELEDTCRKKKIKFRYFLNEYRNNLRSESVGDFLEAFKNYPKIVEEIERINPLIESLLESEDFSKRFELVKLMNIIGKKRFINRFAEDEDIELNEDEKSLVILESERMERELYRLIYSSVDFDIRIGNLDKKTKLSFSNPNNPIYSEYYLTEILRRDSSIELAIIMELPESIKIKFKDNNISEELIKRFRGVRLENGIIRSDLKSFGVKKIVFEFLKFYGIEMRF